MKTADVWFSLYYGRKQMSCKGLTKTTVKNYSGEFRATGFDRGIMDYKDELHHMLDIAIDKIAKEQTTTGNAD